MLTRVDDRTLSQESERSPQHSGRRSAHEQSARCPDIAQGERLMTTRVSRHLEINSTRIVSAVLAAGFCAASVAFAQNGTPINPHSNNVLTVAVYGDSPYGV